MKVLTKSTICSVLKVGFATALLGALMLLAVDLFKNLDTYTTYKVDTFSIIKLTLLYFPTAFLTSMGPAFLFGVTYYLSMLHATNEFISILNSGIRYRHFLLPILFLSVFISILYFSLNECIALKFDNMKEARFQVITFTENGNNDNSNVALSDEDNGLLVYASDYIDETKTLFNVAVLEKDSNGKLISRTNSFKAVWNEENKCWEFEDAYVYTPSTDRKDAVIKHYDKLVKENLMLEPELFRNLSSEISKMSLRLAWSYLMKVRKVNMEQYARLGTEFYKRVLGCLTPLVMIVIACSMNYRFKRNVLFISILCSLCIAVVYYVIQMVTLMLADQGVIRPALGMIIPFVSIVIVTWIFSLVERE